MMCQYCIGSRYQSDFPELDEKINGKNLYHKEGRGKEEEWYCLNSALKK